MAQSKSCRICSNDSHQAAVAGDRFAADRVGPDGALAIGAPATFSGTETNPTEANLQAGVSA
jgi:hypothetical protein